MRSAVELKMEASDDPSRFVPYVQMHETEALLFSDTSIMASGFERPDLQASLDRILQECCECEEINDHQATAPSKRIEKVFPAYRKGSGIRAHAPIILKRIGVDRLRSACPHFNEWIATLEGLGS